MTEGFLFGSQIAAAGVRVLLGLVLAVRLLSAEKPDGKRMIAVLAGAAGLTALLSAAGVSDFYHMIAETAWMAVCASRFLGADFRMSLFVGIFYELAVFFLQFLSAAWAGVLFGSADFLDAGTGRGQIALWVLHVLLAAGGRYLWRYPRIEGKDAFRVASAMVVAGFIAVVTLSQQNTLRIPGDTLYMWTILAVVLMMSVLVFHMNRQYEAEKELARLKAEQAELLERDYTTLNHAYAVNARLFHDVHNHIGVLRQLLLHQKPEQAIRYLDELQAPVREITDTVWTGDETVDYLINSKAQAAAAGGIAWQAQVEFPRRTNLRSADLCAILGNILDNALEAAGQVPRSEGPFVRLTIRRIQQMVVIKVENRFAVRPISKDGTLQTLKEQNGLHGWGIKSARTAAEKYDGTVETSYDGNIFRAVAVLSYEGVSDGDLDKEAHRNR